MVGDEADSHHPYPIAPDRLARNFTARQPNAHTTASTNQVGAGAICSPTSKASTTRTVSTPPSVVEAPQKGSGPLLNPSTFSGEDQTCKLRFIAAEQACATPVRFDSSRLDRYQKKRPCHYVESKWTGHPELLLRVPTRHTVTAQCSLACLFHCTA